MCREKLKGHQLAHYQLMSKPKCRFSPHSTAKTKDKTTNLIKNDIYGIIYLTFATVYSKKSSLKNLIMIIIIIITEKAFTSKRRKGDIEMAKSFSKKYGNNG